MQVAIRTDASLTIGTGHVMRCLALAEQLRADGDDVRFICREHAGHQCDLIEARGYPVARLPLHDDSWLGASWQQDAAATRAALGAAPDWLLVDQYALGQEWELALRADCRQLMVIDDLADRAHACDLLLDQNLADDMAARYAALLEPGCRTLLGPRFSLLREQFGAARRSLRARGGMPRRLFVFFGGIDRDNETGKVLSALAALGQRQLAVDVVIGAANPHAAEVARQCAALPGASLHRQVDNMAELMAQADLAIGAGGGAMWERCAVGLPSIVIAVADNQVPASECMARQGRALYLGRAADVSVELLRATFELVCAAPLLLHQWSEGALALVDGSGARRVARQMRSQLAAARLVLRPATSADCDALYHWRNADQVRRFSGDGKPIALDVHRQWFAGVLADPGRQIVIGEIDGAAVGILRYDREGKSARISVYLTPGRIGQGLGAELIAHGSRWLHAHWPDVDAIDAWIKPDNSASLAAFAAAGFEHDFLIYRQRLMD